MDSANSPPAILRRFFLWLLICSMSAAPSFVMAGTENANREGMAVGVILFVVGYTLLTSTSRFERFYRRPFIRPTMYFGYGLRLILSSLTFISSLGARSNFLIFPDLFCGALSLSAGAFLMGGTGERQLVSGFAGALLVTCIQGAILNVLVFIFMAIIYALQRAFRKNPVEPRGFEVVPLARAIVRDQTSTDV